MRKHANMKPTLIPYTSLTVAYLLHGRWYTPADMAALQADKRNMSKAHDAQANALPYTAAMLERWEERCKPLPTEVVSFQDVKAHWNAAAQSWDDPRFVYIGRGNKAYNLPTSPYANPFKLASEAERPAVIEAYREWLASRALDLEPLRGKVLVCWCKDRKHPDRACHGDVLVEALEDVA